MLWKVVCVNSQCVYVSDSGVVNPLGLWENDDYGTTLYLIASFLSRNNFNSVCIKPINDNTPPDNSLVNTNATAPST